MNTEFYFSTRTLEQKLYGFRHKIVVRDYEAGLLYKHGKFVRQLGPGRHIVWGFGFALSIFDLRKRVIAVAGQELLSADNVGLKLSLAVAISVADPLKAMHEAQDWNAQLYNAVQIALRSVVAAQPAEALLGNRLNIARQLVEAVQPEAERIGVQVHAIEVKDVMLPGELKRLFTEVLKARQEGQAALERARGESAALRNLANAARLLENNPALHNLRLMQSISAAGAAGNTLVMGVPAGFVPLKNGRPGAQPQSETPSEEAE
jgi:regulator of protease activity HflC (stomatin/prohibitin superfamily)